MAKSNSDTPALGRDGTSQAARHLAALDPRHAPIDERTTADLIAFARAYAEELVYYDDANRPAGDWSAFLDTGVTLDEILAFMEDPARLAPGKAERLGRPHVVLFLTFLALLRHTQEHLNTLTRRHLDFYYRSILGMSPRAAAPDHVNVLVQLARGVEQTLLPAGTLLDAGKDSQGQARAYRTDRDVAVNRSRIARLASVRVERQITTIRGAREAHADHADTALLRMLELALGEPRPGDPLPPYEDGQTVDRPLLRKVHALLAFARTHLFMALYELSALVALVQKRDQADAEWAEINGYLQQAARNRLGDPDYQLVLADPRDFDANLEAALGGPPDFGVLPQVSSIEDLYEERVRQDVRDFVVQQLHFASVDDFAGMMQRKLRIDAEWREINRILELAGRRKREDDSYALAPAAPTDFARNLEAAVGPVDFTSVGVASLEAYQQEIARAEAYFHMPAEDVSYVLSIAQMPAPTETQWSRVYDLLAEAHERKVYAARRAHLHALVAEASNQEEAFRAVLCAVLGQEHAADELQAQVERARDLVGSEADVAFLQDMAGRAEDRAFIAEEDWARIVQILERAQRRSERFGRPVAQKVEWLDIHAYEDATAVVASPGSETDRDDPRWKPFGACRPRIDRDAPPSPTLGWAISSPLLCLREGRRTIALTLAFAADDPDGFDVDAIASALAGEPFAVALSTAKGWIEPASMTLEQGAYDALAPIDRPLDTPLQAIRITLDIAEDADPITAPPAGAGERLAADWPVVRLMLRPVWDADRARYITPYEPFARLVLVAAHIDIDVRGLADLSLESDTGVLDPKKPFAPFGSEPGVGSRFYVGHPELAAKTLDSVRFHVEWMRVPEDLQAHYAAYGITAEFAARVALYDRRRELTLLADAPLFASTSAADPHCIDITDVPAALQSTGMPYDYERDTDAVTSADEVSAWHRHLVWVLAPLDFQHRVYPQIATAKASELSAAIALQAASPAAEPVDVQAYQVNPPYTPVIKRLRVDYTCSSEVLLADHAGTAPANDRGDCVHHIHPFGASEVLPGHGQGVDFLPRHDEYEGALYIGIEGARPPQNLSMLFQMAAGSADPDLAPAAVTWSYLSGDRWIDLHDGNLLADGTRGLINTGIIELALPPSEPSTRMPGALHWLRAAVRQRPESVCDIVAIHTQAVPATFVDRDNAADHYDAPLPAGTIAKLVQPMPGIASIEQPYTSYGGTIHERDAEFYTRVSERLRHKQRALSVWDYEHLILERFPQIYKAKCLPANIEDSPDMPGKVDVIVIPDIRNQLPFAPFEPKAPADLLAAIETYLADKIPPQARVTVRNAHYVAVKVRIAVRFVRGCDEGLYEKRLNDDLNRFLSPWAYEEGVDITTGGRIYANSIIDYVERRPYVDYVAGITLFRSDGRRFLEVTPLSSGGYHVAADRQDAVLVAARQHEIDTSWQARQGKGEDDGNAQGDLGIGHMRIGLDFIVGGEAPARAGSIGSMAIGSTFEVF